MLRAGVSTACLYPRVVEEDTMARLLHRFDMTCVSLHPFTCEIEPTMLFSNYPRRADDYLEYCRHYFSAMQQLGAKVFVLHGNKVPAASVNKEMYFERFRRLAELGDSYGVQVAQENVARCTSASLPFLLEMRDALGNRRDSSWTSSRRCAPAKIPLPCCEGWGLMWYTST